MISIANHKYTSSRVQGSVTISQTMDSVSQAFCHAFSQAVEEGMRAAVPTCLTTQILGNCGVSRLLAKPLRKDSLLGRKGYLQGQNVLGSFLKWHLWIYLLQSWATHLLYKYFDFEPNFNVSQAKSDHNFNLNTQHKSLVSKFQTFPLLLGNIIA